MPVLVAAVVTGLLVLAAYAGSGVLALAVIGAQAVLAYGIVTARGAAPDMPAAPDTPDVPDVPDVPTLPGRDAGHPAPAALTHLPGDATTRLRVGALILVTGLASVLAQRLADPDPSGPTVAPALWVLGPAVVLAMLLELARRDGRDRLVESLAATVTGVALAGMLGLLVAAEDLAPLREVAVAYAAGGALLGVAVWWLAAVRAPGWRWPARLVALLLLAGAGVTLWLVTIPDLDAGQQLAVGGVAAITGLVGAGAGHQLGGDTASRSALMPAIAVALTGPAMYLAGRLLFW